MKANSLNIPRINGKEIKHDYHLMDSWNNLTVEAMVLIRE